MSRIRNLKQLQLQKNEIKSRLTGENESPLKRIKALVSGQSESGLTNAFSSTNQLASSGFMDEGVKALLTLGASTAVTRFKLGTVPKMLLTAGVALATPYVVDFIQKKLNKS